MADTDSQSSRVKLGSVLEDDRGLGCGIGGCGIESKGSSTQVVRRDGS